MRIAIIDDEKPARSELRFLIQEILPEADITDIDSGEKALEMLDNHTFDLLCIDINLGDINGSILASTARKIQPNVEIVFATAYDNYAEKAFEVDSLYYLLKPFNEKKVKQMLDKYQQKHEATQFQDNSNIRTKIPLNIDKKIVLVDLSSIVYIEAQNRMCIIHTDKKEYKEANTLNYFEGKLTDKGFFRIQKSYLINMNFVIELYPWFNNTYCVRMEGFQDVVLPVSRGRIKLLKNYLSI